MSEFKISRLRFSWVGEWDDQKQYNKDEIVQYNGKAYVCLVPHVSNGFYTDLQAVIPNWELMMTGQTWKGVWEQFTFYSLDNIVIFGGIVYKCNQEHLSGAVLDTDLTKWDVYAESKTWQSEWTSSTLYGPGDIVQYGGTTYECILSHTSAESDLEGLEIDYNDQLDSTQVKWKVLKEGFQWRSVYATSNEDSSTLRYKINDIVKYGPSVYKCIEGHAPSVEFFDHSSQTPLYETFDETKWELWVPGLDFDNVWSTDSVYQPGDIVLYGGYLFQSKVINNINIIPSYNADDSSDAWELVSKAFDMTGAWDADTSYRVGSVVTYGSDLYVSIQDSTGQVPGDNEIQVGYESDGSSGNTIVVDTVDSVDPKSITVGMTLIGEGFASAQSVQSVTTDDITGKTTIVLSREPDGVITDGTILTFAGTRYPYWELMIPGNTWKGKWTDTANYKQDDVVYWKNATYTCIREHTSGIVNRPDNDLLTNYWALYLQHDQRNSLSDTGEMVLFENGEQGALAIGGQSQVLKAVNGLPVWSDVDFTPNVYYVATNGVDDPTRGTTPDTAWASVKYACEQVAKGTNRQNEKELLDRNKEWIVQETFNWFLYQQNQNIAPFDTSVNFNNEATLRDTRFIIDGVVRDLTRNQTAETVRNALAYFDLESTNKYTNQTVNDQAEYYSLTIEQIFKLINNAITNTAPAQNYQLLEGYSPEVMQYFNGGLSIQGDTVALLGNLERILRVPLDAGTPESTPPENEGAYSTINIKSGTYEEELPILVPARAALNGDELRGAAIKPKRIINTLCTRTFGDINQFIVGSTVNMQHNSPVQFVSLNPVDEISTKIGGNNIVQGITYYVIGDSITDTSFSVAYEPDGEEVPLFTNIGYMYVYGGDALSDMIRVQNATGVRNMTLTGLLGTLTPQNQYETRRPSAGSFVSLDPGDGPDDTRSWITTRSPYIQNVTTFGRGCTGGKIDSTLHNGGNRSMTSNDFTQIISDGIGIWCTGGDALTECVSVFSYYNYAGYFAEDGGRIRATNGNSSYGQYGCIAEGFDIAETPATGTVNNRSLEANSDAVSALGQEAEILKIQFTHAGEDYYEQATNLLQHSNSFIETGSWTTDGNINVTKAPSTPFEGEDAFRLEGVTNLTDSSYISQTINIAPQGGTYSAIAGNNITGSGVDATFDITVTADAYLVAVNNGGSGYVVGNQISIPGTVFGGRTPENDIVITVSTLDITTILTTTHTGVVPAGSALPYTFSIYAKQGSSSYFDMYATFSGYQTRSSYVRFNFDAETASTAQLDDGGLRPLVINSESQQNGWWRISFTAWDVDAQNNQVELRLYPRGIDGITGFTYFYGAQAQIGDKLSFLLNTEDNTPSAYANINVSGAGSNAFLVADELRAESLFQTRLLEDDAFTAGGKGYKIQTNNAQQGNDEFITLAQSEVATAAEYEGMRLVIKSGKGSGQYGRISRYTEVNKRAYVLKESFDTIEIESANATSDRFRVPDNLHIGSLYPGQKIQFTPTFYEQNITAVAQSKINVIATLGDLNNLMIVESTAGLRVGQKINFTGTPFGGVVDGFDYYIINVVDDQKIQISTTLAGGVWPLTNVNIEDPDDAPLVFTNDEPLFKINFPSNTSYMFADDTSDMRVNYPIQFTGVSLGGVTLGTTYYIHDIYDSNNFSISSNLQTLEVTDTDSAVNELTILDTSVLVPLNPILFKDNIVGGLVEDQQYWIRNLIDGTDFTITDTIINTTATETEAVTNLITVDSTTGFTPGSPIIFTGTTFGGIVNDKVYYVQVVNDATTLTISETSAGSAVALTSAVGNIIVRTAGAAVAVTDATGATMVASTTGIKEELESEGGRTMGASFYTETFGGINAGTTYYLLDTYQDLPTDDFAVSGNWTDAGWDNGLFSITFDATPSTAFLNYLSNLTEDDVIYITDTVYGNLELIISTDPWLPSAPTAGSTVSIGTKNFSPFSGGIGADPYNGNMTVMSFPTGSPAPKELQISLTEGGAPVQLIDDAGSMQIGAVGWDHINPGTPAETAFDSTTVYSIEPLIEYSDPIFTQTEMNQLGVGWGYQTIVSNGFTSLIIPLTGETAYTTSDFTTWDTEIRLPVAGDTSLDDGLGGNNPNYNGGWIAGTYGNNTWVLLSPSGKILYSASNGLTWLSGTLPDLALDTDYIAIEYGNGAFIAVGQNSPYSAISTDNCATWTLIDDSVGDDDWRDIAYGKQTFVAISGSSNTVKYSKDNGQTWDSASVDLSLDSTISNWANIEYGNGRFVATSTETRKAVYSFDGITWYESNLEVKGNLLKYGNGIFVLIDSDTGTIRKSADGLDWSFFEGSLDKPYAALGFVFDSSNSKGWFITVDDESNTTKFSGGSRAFSRANITDGKITGISVLNPGSSYSTIPTLKVVDPNNSEDASFQVRIGDGVLGPPTFVNQGFGYGAASTVMSIRGAGFADSFQVGLKIVCSDITRVPQPGDNIEFEGNSEVYRVAKGVILRGTEVPNLEAEIQLSPGLTQADTPAHNTPFTMRSRFSQVRLTNHDFLNIGFGNQLQSNYPLLPEDTGLEPQDEIQETNNGRVFYSSTDQDGNFRVGDLFAVEQATGIVTLSADEFGLDGLTELSIGGVALGGSPVVVKAFSTDGTFTANSNQLVPTQKAIKTYLTSRLSQGGSDTFTGLLTAGTVKVGGPDEITSTVEEGGEGWQVNITTKANVTGLFGNSGWAGDGLAMAYFSKSFSDPTRNGQQ